MRKQGDFLIDNGVLIEYTGTDAEVAVPEGIKEIGFEAFYRKNMVSVRLPKGLRRIGRLAFNKCEKLNSVFFPESLEEIGASAFEECAALSSITQPSLETVIGPHAFRGCDALPDEDGFVIVGGVLLKYRGKEERVRVPDKVREIGYEAFRDCKELISVALPKDLTVIGEAAFLRCERLSGIVLPESVKRVGDQAFCGCRALADEDGFLIIRGVLYDYCGDLSEVCVPGGITRIGTYGFDENKKIRRVTLPDSIKSIGRCAFMECTDLERIDLPESVTDIEDEAFCGCRGLADRDGFAVVRGVLCGYYGGEKRVVIPDKVTRIGRSAFYRDDVIGSVCLHDGVKSIDNGPVRECSHFTHFYRSAQRDSERMEKENGGI